MGLWLLTHLRNGHMGVGELMGKTLYNLRYLFQAFAPINSDLRWLSFSTRKLSKPLNRKWTTEIVWSVWCDFAQSFLSKTDNWRAEIVAEKLDWDVCSLLNGRLIWTCWWIVDFIKRSIQTVEICRFFKDFNWTSIKFRLFQPSFLTTFANFSVFFVIGALRQNQLKTCYPIEQQIARA